MNLEPVPVGPVDLGALRAPGRALVEQFRLTGRVLAASTSAPSASGSARKDRFWVLRLAVCFAAAVLIVTFGPV